MARSPYLYALGFLLAPALIAPGLLQAQATAPAADLGNISVGSNAGGTVAFTFSADVVVSAVSLHTQAGSDQDFQRSTTTPGTCGAATYNTNSSCTVGFTFTPTAQGSRTGTVVLYGSTGAEIGEAYLSGTGVSASGKSSEATGSETTALDSYVWVVNGNGTTTKLTTSGSPVLSGVGMINSSSTTQGGVAADASGGIWSVTPAANMLDFISKDSTLVADYGGDASHNTGGLSQPTALAVDGAGSVWVVNPGSNSISLTNSAGNVLSPQTGLTGYLGSSYAAPSGVAIDISGNVWVSNSGSDTVVEILGAAAPTAPASSALANGTTGARP